jgi:hypothetical protein
LPGDKWKYNFPLKIFTLTSQATEIVIFDGMPNIDKFILERLVFQEKQHFLTTSQHIILIFPSLKNPTLFVNFAEITLLTRTAAPECQIEILNKI